MAKAIVDPAVVNVLFIVSIIIAQSKCTYLSSSILNAFKHLSIHCFKKQITVVVAQLAERSLPIPVDPGSNPVIGNFY